MTHVLFTDHEIQHVKGLGALIEEASYSQLRALIRPELRDRLSEYVAKLYNEISRREREYLRLPK